MNHASKALFSLSIAVLLLASEAGQAHTRWDPNGLIKPRSERDDIKSGPCGEARTNNPVVLEAGATIEVAFESAIYHQGVFRIAFSPANDEGFDQHILADNIPDYSGQRYRTHTITLPETECEACTLQLIQTMEDRSPPSNYFSCADIKLVTAKPDPSDTQPPAAVSGLMGLPGDGQASLFWTNPSEDFSGVVLVQSQAELTAVPEVGQTYQPGDAIAEGEVVVAGLAQSFTASELRAGGTYHFTAFAYDSSYNYSSATSTAVTLAETVQNLAPKVDLVAEQDGRTGTDIRADGSDVILQAHVSDMNPGDTHSFDWSATDNRLVNLDVTNSLPGSFRFSPAGLVSGDYEVIVRVTDSGNPALTTEASLLLSVSAPTPADPAPETGAGAVGLLSLLSLLLACGWTRSGWTRSGGTRSG